MPGPLQLLQKLKGTKDQVEYMRKQKIQQACVGGENNKQQHKIEQGTKLSVK